MCFSDELHRRSTWAQLFWPHLYWHLSMCSVEAMARALSESLAPINKQLPSARLRTPLLRFHVASLSLTPMQSAEGSKRNLWLVR